MRLGRTNFSAQTPGKRVLIPKFIKDRRANLASELKCRLWRELLDTGPDSRQQPYSTQIITRNVDGKPAADTGDNAIDQSQVA